MILGEIGPGERRVRITECVTCNRCLRQVSGGIVVSERVHQTGELCRMIAEFKSSYVCGPCRDAARVAKGRAGKGSARAAADGSDQ